MRLGSDDLADHRADESNQVSHSHPPWNLTCHPIQLLEEAVDHPSYHQRAASATWHTGAGSEHRQIEYAKTTVTPQASSRQQGPITDPVHRQVAQTIIGLEER